MRSLKITISTAAVYAAVLAFTSGCSDTEGDQEVQPIVYATEQAQIEPAPQPTEPTPKEKAEQLYRDAYYEEISITGEALAEFTENELAEALESYLSVREHIPGIEEDIGRVVDKLAQIKRVDPLIEMWPEDVLRSKLKPILAKAYAEQIAAVQKKGLRFGQRYTHWSGEEVGWQGPLEPCDADDAKRLKELSVILKPGTAEARYYELLWADRLSVGDCEGTGGAWNPEEVYAIWKARGLQADIDRLAEGILTNGGDDGRSLDSQVDTYQLWLSRMSSQGKRRMYLSRARFHEEREQYGAASEQYRLAGESAKAERLRILAN